MLLNLFSSGFQLEDHPLISAPPRPHGRHGLWAPPAAAAGLGLAPQGGRAPAQHSLLLQAASASTRLKLGEKIPVPTLTYSQRMSEVADTVNGSLPCAFASLDQILPNIKPHKTGCSFRDWSCPSGSCPQEHHTTGFSFSRSRTSAQHTEEGTSSIISNRLKSYL